MVFGFHVGHLRLIISFSESELDNMLFGPGWHSFILCVMMRMMVMMMTMVVAMMMMMTMRMMMMTARVMDDNMFVLA